MKIFTIRDNPFSVIYEGEGETPLEVVRSYMKEQRKVGTPYCKVYELKFALELGWAIGKQHDTFESPRGDVVGITY